MQDLCRAREDAVADRTRARHRLAKLLIRQGIANDGRRWTQAHRRWLLTPALRTPRRPDHLLELPDYVGSEEYLPTLTAHFCGNILQNNDLPFV